MTTPQNRETVRRIQVAMATAYTSAGAWYLPPLSRPFLRLSLAPAFFNQAYTTQLLMQCFGAQAMTVGLLLGVSDMTVKSFTCFGLAMVPYLGFNVWFLGGPGRGVFSRWLWADFVGNIVFFGGSLVAAKLLRDDDTKSKETRKEK
ncbi:hypothetical protein BKA65DRAFT_498348 [Rhexocercosporidium sp. MPI-PUGE-AT-0058]|nr:hypothetical protein BKA65DRAFT_498348 [Rhexocercosporidium sp. MPI-PUGE-AT-0058]